MFRKFVKKIRRNRGFTMMEVLTVVGIIAVTCAIAIPAVFSMQKSTQLKQNDDYAKSVYMAAQNNLTQMRSMGELGMLSSATSGAAKDDAPAIGNGPSSKYLYAYSKGETKALDPTDTGSTSYDLIVPSTLDTAIRNQYVIVEYHPGAGIIYSVFYSEKSDLIDQYNDDEINEIIRTGTEKERKKLGIGYYSATDENLLEEQAFTVYNVSASISFENGEEATLKVEVPIQDSTHNNTFFSDLSYFASGLELTLTMTGENGGVFSKTYPSAVDGGTGIFQFQNGQTVVAEIPLDSLSISGSFTHLIANQNQPDDLTAEDIAAGDNISVTADVTFYPRAAEEPIIMVESAVTAGINPMFHSLYPKSSANGTDGENGEDGANAANGTEANSYILAVSNGRHLQNMASLDPDFIQKIDTIVFVDPNFTPAAPEGTEPTARAARNGTAKVLDWNVTAGYYEDHYNITDMQFVPAVLADVDIDGNSIEIRNLAVSKTIEDNAGLFAKLTNVNIKDITLVDSKIHAEFATATGALAGTANNVTLANCNVTNSSATQNDIQISGKTNVGGLVGYAENSTFNDCDTTNTIVQGVGTGNSNLGGLVGTSEASDFTDCEAISVSVTSADLSGSDNSKNALGGLVGSAIAKGATDSTFTDCSADSNTRITSAADSFSDLGGFVGYASGARFSDCSSSALATGTAISGSNPIPNNNLGGFVGRSVLGDYSGITVELSYLPQYAEDAGGFAGILKGGSIEGLEVTFASNAGGDATTRYFGGIASRCTDSAALTDVSMEANALIDNATDAAGGAFAYAESCQVMNARIKLPKGITANSAAGFAVGSRATVHNSYVHGIISGKTTSTGFVHDNSGSIRRCLANVTNGGDAFVANNNGSVKDCYGWGWGGSKGTDHIKIGGSCAYSYFVNGAGDADDLILYGATDSDGNSKQVAEISDTAALADTWALDILKEGTKENEDAVWQAGNSQYPYPRLIPREHVGNYNQPATAAAQDYRLMYEETYDDGSTGKLLFNYSGTAKALEENTLDSGKAIKSTDYYLYHRTTSTLGTAHKDRNSSDFETWAKDKFQMESANELYSVYKLDKAKSYLDGAVKTYFPHSDTNGYWVRTADQFANISTEPGGKFQVQENISITKPLATFSGTLTASNGAVITATTPLMMEMTGGKIEGVTVTPSGDFAIYNAVFVDKATGGTINKCTVTAAVSGKPFVTYDAQTLEGVTHSSTVKNESITQVAVPNPEGFSPVSNPKGAAPVTITECYIGSEAAVNTLYYYSIGTQQKFTTGTQQTLSAQTRTFQDLWDSAKAGGTVSSYYLKEGVYFFAEAITATYTEAVPEDTEATEGTENTEGTEGTEAVGEGTYKFTFSESMVIEMTEAGLESTTANGYGITLYRLSDGITMSGPCLLQCNEKYLTASGFTAEAPTADTIQSYLWTRDSSGIWTNSAEAITATASASEGEALILVTAGDAAEKTNTLTAMKCDFYYDCAYKGMGYTLYTP